MEEGSSKGSIWFDSIERMVHVNPHGANGFESHIFIWAYSSKVEHRSHKSEDSGALPVGLTSLVFGPVKPNICRSSLHPPSKRILKK